jgi:translation elongation factor EF-1alpha
LFDPDAGKSTAGGQILLLSGQVDKQTIKNYEEEAKKKRRESWLVHYIFARLSYFLRPKIQYGGTSLLFCNNLLNT